MVPVPHITIKRASGAKDDRPFFAVWLRACRSGDCLVYYRTDRITRSLSKFVLTMDELEKCGVGYIVAIQTI